MEDNLRMVGAEHEVEAGSVTYITDDGHKVQLGETLFHLQTYIVHRGLGIVIHHQTLDAEGGQLTAELASYTACGSSHHDGLVLEVVDDFVQRYLDFRTTQQVFNLDFAYGVLQYLPVDDFFH